MTELRPTRVAAPVLETPRLILRGHELQDFEESAAMWAHAEVTRFIGGRPFTEEEVWSRLLRYLGHWAALGFGYWVVREKATGLFVGEVGFADYRRDITPPFGDAPESGWVLAPAAHGRGYATEAVTAALAWGDAHFQASRTVCLIDEDNAASMRVAERCGYREFARTAYKGQPAVLWERPAARR